MIFQRVSITYNCIKEKRKIVDLTALDSDHCTALHHALKYDTSEFKAMVSSVGQHIDPNVLNKSSETILIEAAKTKDDKLMTIHDTFGARYDPNIQDATGNTCLMYAVLNHSPDVIAALLRHPVIDLTIKNGFHKTNIYIVKENMNVNLKIRMMVEFAYKKQVNPAAGTQQTVAFHLEKIRELVIMEKFSTQTAVPVKHDVSA